MLEYLFKMYDKKDGSDTIFFIMNLKHFNSMHKGFSYMI